MERKNTKLFLIAFVITLAASGLALGQDSVALSVAPSALRALETGGIAEGQKLKIEGIVTNQNDQSFTVRDAKGTETVVVVTDKTVIKKERKGWFHRDKSSSADDIRCGLGLKVEGQGNSDGQLVAKNITIDEPRSLHLTCASAGRVCFDCHTLGRWELTNGYKRQSQTKLRLPEKEKDHRTWSSPVLSRKDASLYLCLPAGR